jgi:uncharacterized Zn finger protein (UPF0148 family)
MVNKKCPECKFPMEKRQRPSGPPTIVCPVCQKKACIEGKYIVIVLDTWASLHETRKINMLLMVDWTEEERRDEALRALAEVTMNQQ